MACATVLFYSTHRLFQVRAYQGISSGRLNWLTKNRRILLISIMLSAIFLAGLTYFLFRAYLLYVLVLGLLSVIYLFPLLKNDRRVRDIPYLKIFAIAVGWSIITVSIPAFLMGEYNFWQPWMIGERFLFFLLITIPFDIRDRQDDLAKGVHTLATAFSDARLTRFAFLLFLLYALLIFFSPFLLSFKVSLILAGLLAFLIVCFVHERRPLWYFSIVVDGLIAVRLGLLFVVA